MPTHVPTEEQETQLTVEETVAGVRCFVAAARTDGRSIGLVPTMGALHSGHISLIDAARRRCDCVAVSLFVNPTQFGPNEDYARYPRTLDADLDACRNAGVDFVFLPAKEELYPAGFATSVEVTGLSDRLEGAIRPGHFRGVATVVLKLFNIVAPDVAFFGAKDYQQQLVIRQMVHDLDLPVEIATCPTIREADGLALSSRNRYLDAGQRRQALSLSAALTAGCDRYLAGEDDVAGVNAVMRTTMESAGVAVDYAVTCDPVTLTELKGPQSRMVLLVAGRLGSTRLIDNLEVSLTSR